MKQISPFQSMDQQGSTLSESLVGTRAMIWALRWREAPKS